MRISPNVFQYPLVCSRRHVAANSYGDGLTGNRRGAGQLRIATAFAWSPVHGSQTVQLVYSDWQTDWFAGMAQEMLGSFIAPIPPSRYFSPDPDNLGDEMMADFQQGNRA